MKICDIADAYHPTGGGIRTYLDEKARFVRASAEHEHALIIPADRDYHEQEGRTEVFGVRSPIIPGSAPYRVMLRHGRVMDILDRLHPEVIELANPYMQPRLARSLGANTGAVVAGFYHADFPEAYVEATLRGRLGSRVAGAAKRAAERYAGFAHRRLDLTVVASQALRQKLLGWGVPHVELVPLGVELDRFHPDRRDPAWRRELGVADDETLLVYAGRVDREKRVDVLVEMMRRLPAEAHCRLVVLGRGPRWNRVRDQASGDPRVRVLPFETDRTRLARCLASADIYVTAARFETFGLSVIEAQACGLPVVGQRAGAMVDRVPSGTGLLVDALDPEAMATAVRQVIQDGPRDMGRRARSLVEADSSWDTTFRRVLDLYARRRKPAAERGHVHQPA